MGALLVALFGLVLIGRLRGRAARAELGWAVVDRALKPVGDLRFDDAQAFSEGLAGFRSGRARVARAAGLDYEWAWIDVEGQVVGNRWFAGLQPFNGEHAFARIPR